MAHGSTHVALSTEAESTTSTDAESTTSTRLSPRQAQRRLRPLSFCPDSLEGFTAYPRYFEQRNLSHNTSSVAHNTSRVAHCAEQLITQHLERRTTQQSSLIEEFHRKMQNASSTGLPRVPEVIFQRFNIYIISTFLLLLLTLIYT